MANFVQLLAKARRQAKLSGRPLSSQETAGIAEGVADTADVRAARLKSLKLEEERQAESKRQALVLEKQRQEELRQQAEELGMKRMAAKDAAEQTKRTTGASVGSAAGTIGGAYYGSTITGASVGASMSGPYAAIGAVVGAAVGYVAGGWSHLCSALQSTVPGVVSKRQVELLQEFRQWVGVKYPWWLKYYDDAAPVALRRMKERLGIGGMTMLLDQLRPDIVDRTADLTAKLEMEEAFKVYSSAALPVLVEYAPEFRQTALDYLEMDNG